MKNLISKATKTRRRKVATIAATLFLLTGGTALAYYAAVWIGASGASSEVAPSTGGASSTVTNTAITLSASWPASQLFPGQQVPLQISATENDPNQTHDLNGTLTATVTTSKPATCLASWLAVTPAPGWTGIFLPVPIGTTNMEEPTLDGATLNFQELDGVDQTACRGATITVTLAAPTD